MDERMNIFKDRDVLVVGLARSGAGAASLLSVLGSRVTVTDRKSADSLAGQIEKLPQQVRVVAGENPVELFGSADLIVVSPGVPLDIPPLKHAREKGVPVIAELELAYQALRSDDLIGGQLFSPSVQFIGITGTNGKSTTTTLVDLMMKRSGYRTLLGGNIGNALTDEIFSRIRGAVPGPAIDHIVAEISSFQLEAIEMFRPSVAAILNITPDHLDRYDSMEDYSNAKAGIFKNQLAEDSLILNADDQAVMELYDARLRGRAGAPEVFFFSRQREVNGAYCRDGIIYCNLPKQHMNFSLAAVEEIRIRGVHNIENAMAASLVALVSGCPPRAIRDVLKEFPGLEHRLEFVKEAGGVVYINDSKGTNIGAVAKSLESFDNLILIMGGLDKNSDFSVLPDMVKGKVRLLVLLGEAKDKIAAAVGGAVEVRKVGSLEEAVRLSMTSASPGDVVMLSPGCASFDMFADFEDRGRKFKAAVREIVK